MALAVSQIQLIFDDLDSLGEYGQVFCTVFCNWALSDVFLRLDWRHSAVLIISCEECVCAKVLQSCLIL